jgi:tetratricopeptide (TPR) repeat protein
MELSVETQYSVGDSLRAKLFEQAAERSRIDSTLTRPDLAEEPASASMDAENAAAPMPPAWSRVEISAQSALQDTVDTDVSVLAFDLDDFAETTESEGAFDKHLVDAISEVTAAHDVVVEGEEPEVAIAILDRSVEGVIEPTVSRLALFLGDFPDSDVARRLLLFIAAKQGRGLFSELGLVLQELAGVDASAESLAIVMASLVDAGVLLQNGPDALCIQPNMTLDDVVRDCSSGSNGQLALESVISSFVSHSEQASEAFNPNNASVDLSAAIRLSELARLPHRQLRGLLLRRARAEYDSERFTNARDLFLDVYMARAGDEDWVTSALGLVEIALLEQRFDRANERLQDIESQDLNREGPHWLECNYLRAWLDFEQGRQVDAVERLRANLTSKARGERLKMHSLLGEMLVSNGHWGAAANQLEAAAAGFADLGDVRGQAMAQVRLASLYRLAGDLEHAEDLLLRARGSAKAIGSNRVSALAWTDLSEIMRVTSRLDESEALGLRAIGFAEATRLPGLVQYAQLGRVRLLSARGFIESAVLLCDQCRANTPARQGRFAAQFAWALVLVRSGRLRDAFEHCRSLQRDVRYPHEAAPFWGIVSWLCGALGRIDGQVIARQRMDAAKRPLPAKTQAMIANELERALPITS